jgi:site-specific recombinase XerD
LALDYQTETRLRVTEKLRELSEKLPEAARLYLRYIADSRQPLTRLGYARDLALFFDFLSERGYGADPVKVKPDMIIEFSEYLALYERARKIGGKTVTVAVSNSARGKSRKLSAVRSFYRWMYRRGQIVTDPTALIEMPRISSKNVVALEPNEAADLLDAAEFGDGIPTDRGMALHEERKERDLALLSLLLGTGMRVSECVGIDLAHLDMESSAVKVTRKGGAETVLYFGEEVAAALRSYLVKRAAMKPLPGHENALFISRKRTRLRQRQIEYLVKNYARGAVPIKTITPHKLRSTFGTNLYRETGDIYLVADVLGHKDVNTTTARYAKVDENRRRLARTLRLRED